MITLFIRISILTLLLTGCATGLFSVHKIDIQQGNALTEADAAKVVVGMDRKSVKDLLGDPVLNPIFNNDRWEYVYYLKEPDVPAVERNFLVIFKNDRVTEIR